MIHILRSILPASLKDALREARKQLQWLLASRKIAQVTSRLKHYHANRKTVFFFTPEAGVVPYMQIEALLGKTLVGEGHNAVFVRCFDLLQRCPVKEMVGLPYDASPRQSRNVCVTCWRSSKKILDQYDLDYIDARELIGADEKSRVDAALLNLPADPFNTVYAGIAVGKLAAYDFSIARKHPIELELASDDKAVFKQYLQTVLTSVEIFEKATKRIQINSLACFDEYGMMSAVRICARDRGIHPKLVSFAYHFDGDMQRIIGWSNLSIVKEQQWRLTQWPKWRDVPLKPETVHEVAEDVFHRISGKGSHIYSSNKSHQTNEIFDALELSRGRKTLGAFTSSRDEHDALLCGIEALGYKDELPQRGAFLDTFEWLHAIIGFVESSGDLQLVVRLHPRLASTHRDSIVSRDYVRYKTEFSTPYKHTRIIWPEDKTSSYDLAEFVDVALVSWSSMGQELARLGIPVISGYPSMFTMGPDDGFIVTCIEKQDYFQQIRTALIGKPPAYAATLLRGAFRWYHMSFLGNTIDFSDLVPERKMRALPEFFAPRNASVVEQVFVDGLDAIDFNLTDMMSTTTECSEDIESVALYNVTARMTIFLLTGIQGPANPDALKWFMENLKIEDNNLKFLDNGVFVTKWSPMVARLAAIAFSLEQKSH